MIQGMNIVSTTVNRKYTNFMQQATVVSQLSPDGNTKVGAILVDPSDMSVIATGYNGFIRGAPDYKLPKVGPEKYDYMVHAETNIIAHCAKKGIKTDGCMLFCTLSPCHKCTRTLIQAGVTTVVCSQLYKDFEYNSSMGDININVEQNGDLWILRYTQ